MVGSIDFAFDGVRPLLFGISSFPWRNLHKYPLLPDPLEAGVFIKSVEADNACLTEF